MNLNLVLLTFALYFGKVIEICSLANNLIFGMADSIFQTQLQAIYNLKTLHACCKKLWRDSRYIIFLFVMSCVNCCGCPHFFLLLTLVSFCRYGFSKTLRFLSSNGTQLGVATTKRNMIFVWANHGKLKACARQVIFYQIFIFSPNDVFYFI